MKLIHDPLLACLVLAGLFASGAPARQSPPAYRLDDGSSELVAGLLTGGEIACLTGFDTGGGLDFITSVHVAFGSLLLPGTAPPNGSPATVYVWEDTDDDGDPTTGLVLLNETAITVEQVDTDLLNVYTLGSGVLVDKGFFVGVSVDHAPAQFPSPIDQSIPSAGRAWLSGSPVPGGFNPSDLGDPGHIGVFDLDQVLPGVWLLAAGIDPPAIETYCTAKLNSCALMPAVQASGTSSATSTSGFVVEAVNARGGNKIGLVIYTDQGPRIPATPLSVTGFLCINGAKRGILVFSGGTAGQCDGVLSMDMNAFAAGVLGGNPKAYLSLPGTVIDCQFWARDTFANGDLVTGALEYTILP